MKAASFWPPRRSRDRLAAELFQRRNPGAPWLTRQAIRLLPDLISRTDQCLEWGAGASTAWLSKRVKRLVSVEHDPVWFERVRGTLAADGGDRESVLLLSPEPADEPAASPYVRVIDDFDDGELGVCLVDGEHRAACALAAIPKLASGGLLLVDDVHGYLDHPTSSPHSRHGHGPLDDDWRQFGGHVGSWRLIWTSDGYSDTAIWIKP